jgi:hypothetical protein
MKATCSWNAEHKKFITVAHVSQDWVVDEEGNFLEQYGSEGETVASPCSGNTWACYECGATAIVED